jgi:hypothetical protein
MSKVTKEGCGPVTVAAMTSMKPPGRNSLLRLLLVAPLAVLAIGLSACSGHTDPATNVGSTTATVHATASCTNEDVGIYWFRWRGTNWGSADPAVAGNQAIPWKYESQPRGYDCRPGGNFAPGTNTVSATIGGLVPASTYRVQICGTLGAQFIDPEPLDPNDGWKPPQPGCWNKDGKFVPDAGGFPKDADSPIASDTTFTTGPYNGSTADPGSYNVASAPDPTTTSDITTPQESIYCPQGQTCAAGVGTGWWCGHVKMGKSIFAKWSIFRGTLNDGLCWGTGKNRGQYQNYNNLLVGHDTTEYGSIVVGVVYDDIVGTNGPAISNGKVTMMRNLHFHTCNPPIGSLPVAICLNRHDYYLKLKIVAWTSTDNRLLYQTYWSFAG